uniref:Uncharacterized protein n=1 Tax=Anguilla anguilla TaxID=7936 RepID=A0A0E9PCB4_ANGAN
MLLYLISNTFLGALEVVFFMCVNEMQYLYIVEGGKLL